MDTTSMAINELITELNGINAVVVVEGKRDAQALRSLGFNGTLMQFHSYGGYVRFADIVAKHNRVVILFDYDEKGRYMTYRLVKLLQRRTRPDLTYRRRLARITQGKIRFVEQLCAYNM